jgi:hypothetical protein
MTLQQQGCLLGACQCVMEQAGEVMLWVASWRKTRFRPPCNSAAVGIIDFFLQQRKSASSIERRLSLYQNCGMNIISQAINKTSGIVQGVSGMTISNELIKQFRELGDILSH